MEKDIIVDKKKLRTLLNKTPAKKSSKTSKTNEVLSQIHDELKEMLLPVEQGGKNFTFDEVSKIVETITGVKINKQTISKYVKTNLNISRTSLKDKANQSNQ